MKIYFDGCSHTWGAELLDPNKSRYSKIVCDHFNAEEYNIAKRGGGCKRVVRNLINHDLSQYDMFVIEMPSKIRFEYFSGNGDWVGASPHALLNKRKNKHPVHDTLIDYAKYIFTEKQADSEQLIHYTIIRGLLENKPHIIIGLDLHYLNGINISVPVDKLYAVKEKPKKLMGKVLRTKDNFIPKAHRGHPNEEGHEIIAEDVISWLTTDK